MTPSWQLERRAGWPAIADPSTGGEFVTKGVTRLRLLGAAAGVLASAASAQAPDGFVALKSTAIRQALVGKMISYEPPGSADMAIHEIYDPDGTWSGLQNGRGPMPFSGRWKISANQVCVTVSPEAFIGQRLGRPRCRTLWQNAKTGKLMMNYLRDQPSSPFKAGLQTLWIQDIPTIK